MKKTGDIRKGSRGLLSGILVLAQLLGMPAVSFAADEPVSDRGLFSACVYGPGVENLSAMDDYARYQWALKNDAEVQYIEIVNRFAETDPVLAESIDQANNQGDTALVEGPDAYRQTVIYGKEGIDIHVLPAWQEYDASSTARRDVVVALIDSGVDISHPDLKDSIWVNEDEILDDGIDNDGNGYIDDRNGWNFFHGTNQLMNGKEEDHGTHSAGTIAASRGKTGIAGIADCSHVKIMPLKVLGTEQGVGEETAIIQAIHYAEANGASICNLSFGSSLYYPELERVMQESEMLFVVSAGNGDAEGKGIDIDRNPEYPAAYEMDNLITVANLMFDGTLNVSSNYGPEHVDLAAPGTFIVSTITENSYGFMNGTSMAAPMVTGAAAFLYSYRTDVSLGEVKQILLETVKPLPSLEGKVHTAGMLDVYGAIRYGR